MSSIAIAFVLALAKTLVGARLIKKKNLKENFLQIRKSVPNKALYSKVDKAILDFLGIVEKEKI